LISVRFDDKELVRKLNNSVDYSYGFVEGINMKKFMFMRFLGGYAAEALGKYIDSMARMNPGKLHHVYESNEVGKESARLFEFTVVATAERISFIGSFLPSSKPSEKSKEPLVNKANIMENGIAITISPKKSDFLVFESDDGETVFTRNAIVIEHPGGDEVAGSFGDTVDAFFSQYFTNALLRPLLKDLERADEFVFGFGRGSRSSGVQAGRKYMSTSALGEIL